MGEAAGQEEEATERFAVPSAPSGVSGRRHHGGWRPERNATGNSW